MLKSQKKISHKELKKDKLVTAYFESKDWYGNPKNKKKLTVGIGIVKASCIAGVGAVYEAKGDMKKAAEYYEKSTKVNKDVVINQENLFYAIRTYTQAGDKESARRLFASLKEQYPKSKYIAESKRFESEFKN